MIFTDRKITIRNGKSSINEPVILYRGDFEVSIKFTIMESKFRFKSGVNLVDSEKASYGQLAILAPYGGNVFSEVVKCEDGTVTFTLTKEMIDQLEEVGLYSFQIRLFDYYRESRVSIPPVEFGIEVREPVASEDHDNEVNNAIVGYSIAKVVDPKEENVGPTFDANGQYNKTDWETGDRITEGKLNKIEDALDVMNKKEQADIATLDKRIVSNFNILDSSKADKNAIFTMSNMGQDVKEAMTGGSVGVVGNHSVLSQNIVPNQVTHDKLGNNVLKFKESNLITEVFDNGFVNWNNGTIQESSNYVYSNYISVKGYSKLYGRCNYHYAFYDSNLNFISGNQGYPNGVQPIEITVPEQAEFIRVCILKETKVNFVLGSSMEFVSYGGSVNTLVIPSSTPNGEKIRLDDNMVTNASLMDGCVSADKTTDDILKCEPTSNRYIVEHYDLCVNWNTDGLMALADYCTSIYIPIKEGDVIYQSFNAHYAIYNEAYKLIDGHRDTEYTNPIVAPAGSAYIRVSTSIEAINTYMITINEEMDEYVAPGYCISKVNGLNISIPIGVQINTSNLYDNCVTKDKVNYEIVTCVPTKNAFVKEHDDVFVNWVTGGLQASSSYSTSIYIPIKEGDVIYQTSNAHYAIYDEAYKLIDGHRDTEYTNPIVAPASSAYIRVSPHINNVATYMITINEEIDEYVAPGYIIEHKTGLPITLPSMSSEFDKIANSRLYGKKVSWYGTSITQGYGWCQLVNAAFSFNATNNGVGGTAICKESVNSSMCTRNRMLGLYEDVVDENTGETTLTGTPIPSDVEIIFIEGGTNDWARNWAIGNKEFSESFDDQTFAGACHLMFKNMTELFPNAEIIIVGAPFGKMADRSSFTNKYGVLNNQNLQTVEYGDILLDIAGKWGIKGFNMGRAMQIHDNNIADLIPDGLHLTTNESKQRAADAIIAYLLTL